MMNTHKNSMFIIYILYIATTWKNILTKNALIITIKLTIFFYSISNKYLNSSLSLLVDFSCLLFEEAIPIPTVAVAVTVTISKFIFISSL